MRLIDAEHLKRWILARWEETDPRSEYPLKAIEIMGQVDREDTIDVVEVIRCEDCKHYKPSAVASRKMCIRKDVDGMQVCYDFQPDDFCSHGERRTDEAD